jgi:CheY-like chemotaxis protein
MAKPPPLVAISGYGQDEDRQEAFKAGFHAYLTKPVDVAELSQLLQRLFA